MVLLLAPYIYYKFPPNKSGRKLRIKNAEATDRPVGGDQCLLLVKQQRNGKKSPPPPRRGWWVGCQAEGKAAKNQARNLIDSYVLDP
jgi:hypothetical protein